MKKAIPGPAKVDRKLKLSLTKESLKKQTLQTVAGGGHKCTLLRTGCPAYTC